MKIAASLLLLMSLVVFGCDRDQNAGAAPEPPDRYADGKVLSEERKLWRASWAAVKPLPSCAELGADKAKSCEDAQVAYDALKKLERANGAPELVMDAALKLADTASTATELVRSRGMRWWLDRRTDAGTFAVDGGASDAAPAPSASGKPASSAPQPGVKPGHEGHGHEGHGHGVELPPDPNPWSTVYTAYDRAALVGLTRLAGFLRIAPLEVRKKSLERYQSFVTKHPKSVHADRQLREAFLLESNRAQKDAIAALRQKAGMPDPMRGVRRKRSK